jgi:glycosyltransferase involved in cell wall biosynthesis
VIASPVGALAQIVVPDETGFHAAGDADWTAALDAMLSNRDLRTRLGLAGRAAAASRWSFDAHASRFETALRGIE